ncbi:hypothetical protein [Nostoc sp. FACHB-280]|uniref:hypothetical protein n=1 Tax=Nostoc sp. FACHB-280 TaxID=2692839 RepID=UPI00168C0E30|nr:hypothetical protein [Nostoc sp. FACHB-280]MBD2496585.1 hypothetical protein [Nostoc sp. FACHB-280]
MQILLPEQIIKDKRVNQPNKVLQYFASQGLVPHSWQSLTSENISEETYCIKIPGTDVRCLQVQTPAWPPSYIYFMQTKFTSANLLPIQNAIVNAVLCLYGAYGIIALLEDGSEISLINPRIKINQPIKNIFYDERPAFTEKETIERQASVIAQLIEAQNIYSCVKITVPDAIQYCSYMLLDAYLQGFCSNHQLLEYIAKVSNRHTQVVVEYRRVLEENLADLRQVKIITPVSILEDFKSYFMDCIHNNRQPDINFVKKQLYHNIKLFADIISLQGISENKCETFKDLQYISYILPLIADSLSEKNSRSYCMAVANINERQIGQNTIKIATELIKQYPDKYTSKNINFGGMYLASRIGVPNPLVGTPWYHEHREFYITPYICDTHNIDRVPVLACNLEIPKENLYNLELIYRRKAQCDRPDK